MLFNSLQYLVFLPVVILIYFILPVKVRYIWLLVASYFFYMCWNAKYALLILASTVVTYGCSQILDKRKKPSVRKAALAASLIINLGILVWFKYTNFFLGIAEYIGTLLHVEMNVPALDILLPVGISFYTFQALGYTIDVYRRKIPAEKNFLWYALFVSFFPQLVAGPIERSSLLTQLKEPRRFSFDNFREGTLDILWGMFLKVVLADRIAIFVDTVYGEIGTYPGWYLTVATALFAVQILCDFGGYTTIAIGSAKILGIRLMENFDAPYLSSSIARFWKRWHISLTSWFTDYLYIPLGGNRKGKLRTYVNKMITFLVSGLWHGANITFVVWGGINGLYLVLGEILQPVKDRLVELLHIRRDSFGHKLFWGVITFCLVTFSWIFFRAQTLPEAIAIIKSIFSEANIWILFDGSIYDCGLDRANFLLMVFGILVLLFVDGMKRKGRSIKQAVIRQDAWFRIVFISGFCLFLMLFGKYGPTLDKASFIYFQF